MHKRQVLVSRIALFCSMLILISKIGRKFVSQIGSVLPLRKA